MIPNPRIYIYIPRMISFIWVKDLDHVDQIQIQFDVINGQPAYSRIGITMLEQRFKCTDETC